MIFRWHTIKSAFPFHGYHGGVFVGNLGVRGIGVRKVISFGGGGQTWPVEATMPPPGTRILNEGVDIEKQEVCEA
jgi:hypothetical protein